MSRQHGRPSNNRLCEEQREPLLSLLRGKYAGFGPTFAVEKLAEHEGIAVSKETIRQLQIAHRLWRPKKRREKRVYSLRERRPRFGELIQIDCLPPRRRGAVRTRGWTTVAHAAALWLH